MNQELCMTLLILAFTTFLISYAMYMVCRIVEKHVIFKNDRSRKRMRMLMTVLEHIAFLSAGISISCIIFLVVLETHTKYHEIH